MIDDAVEAAADDMGFDRAEDLVEMLNARGLTVISTSTLEQVYAGARVLEASAKAPESELRMVLSLPGHPSWEIEHARAELARRRDAPAAPTRSDSGVAVMTALHQMAASPTRTESEQRVLDASAAVRDTWLEHCTSPSCDHIRPWVAAELARRRNAPAAPHVGITVWGEPTPEHMRKPTAPTRTDSEQRVLDACEAIEFSYWEGARGCTSASFDAVLDAEFARREAAK